MRSKFDYKSAYFHLVSLVAIISIIFAAIAGGHGLLRLVFPVLSMDQYTWERVESFEAYKRSSPKPVRAARSRTEPRLPDDTISEPPDEAVSDAELRKNWEQERDLLVSGQKRRGLWSLIESLVSLVIVIPIYWWHRRMAKRLPETEKDKENPE